MKEPDFAQGLLAGAAFGREVYVREERLRIRRAIAPHLKRLRAVTLSVAEQLEISRAIDAATRAPRKEAKRGK